MVATWVFADNAYAILSIAVNTTPAVGTSEIWTLSSGSTLPAVATGITQYAATVNPITGLDSSPEIVLVTNTIDSTHIQVTRGYGGIVKTHIAGDFAALVVDTSWLKAIEARAETHKFVTASSVTINNTPFSLLIDVGGATIIDTNGVTWQADLDFTGGTTFDVGAVSTLVSPTPTIDRYTRFGMTNYVIPVPYAGVYVLQLHLGPETNWTAINQRLFDVSINGSTVLTNLDLFATVGSKKTYLYTNRVTVSSPLSITVGFIDRTDHSLLSGILVYSDTTPPANPYPPSIMTGNPSAPPSLVIGDPGVWTGNPTLGYQWSRIVNGTKTTIAGATSPSYTTVTADTNAALQLAVTGTNASGTVVATTQTTATIPAVVVSGASARTSAGIHADSNIYLANTPTPYDRNNQTQAFARGATAAGFSSVNSPAWFMLESNTDLYNDAYIVNQLLYNVPNLPGSAGGINGNTGDFSNKYGVIDAVGGTYPTPNLCYSLYGAFSNPSASVAQVGAGNAAVDQALQYLAGKLNLLTQCGMKQISIRYGFEQDIGTTASNDRPGDWVAASRHVHDVLKAALTIPVLFEWNAFGYLGALADDSVIGNYNPNVSANNNHSWGYLPSTIGYNVAQYYPGDAYVDIIGCDTYELYPNVSWPSDLTFLTTAKNAQAFALRHGKRVAYSEWGLEQDNWTSGVAPMDAAGTGDGGVGARSVNAVRGFLSMIDTFPPTGPGSCIYHMFFDGKPAQPNHGFMWDIFPNAKAAYKSYLGLS